jgi:hypothetical protein
LAAAGARPELGRVVIGVRQAFFVVFEKFNL